MSVASTELSARYAVSLGDYLSGRGESALEAAYECGRAAMAEGRGVVELVRLFGQAMNSLLAENPDLVGSRSLLARSVSFLAESLSPFEMTHRGFREANTELRRLYQQLERHSGELAFANDELQRQIRERRRVEEDLRHAQKMESIGTLAGGVAHDFNNLLNIISAHGAIAAMDGIELKRRADSLAAIQTAVLRGATLVRQLLTFARKSKHDLAPVAINHVVDELSAILRETFPKRIQFGLALAEALPEITADHGQLTQALLNLCVNARDAMPEGGALTIATDLAAGTALRSRFPEARETAYVAVRVSDSGEGIEEAIKERIFEPFFSTKEAGKGAGLGLAVVYGIVAAHSGFVDVETARGRGTTFSLFFPASPAGTPSPAPRKSSANASPGGRGETILLVEDEEILLDALKTILEIESYSVLLARDGPEAFRLFESHSESIAVVLADLGLPGVSGWQVVRDLQQRKPGLKGMVATGFLDPDLDLEMLANGVAATLQKPYAADEIVRKIREVLDSDRREPA
jgi:signal transduction histidine kinase/ActR/RegA family two-component response regulator